MPKEKYYFALMSIYLRREIDTEIIHEEKAQKQ